MAGFPNPPTNVETPSLAKYHGPPRDVKEAIARLENGNREFARQLAHIADPLIPNVLTFEIGELALPRADGKAQVQQPFAAFLACSDARVPTEIVLGQASNSVFVVRVAGNVLGAECLGSMDYAVTHLGDSLKVLAVLGHSGCGAVTAAVDAFLSPSQYLSVASSHPIRAVVDRIFVAAQAAAMALAEANGWDVISKTGYRLALIEMTVALNAALTAATLKREFRDKLGPNREVVFGVYNLTTGRVKLPLSADGDVAIRLAPPPPDAASFDRLAVLLATSDAIRGLLSGPPR